MSVYVKGVDRNLGIVLGVCGHWWQAKDVSEVMATDCPTCGRPPGVFIGCWDETWPEPEPDADSRWLDSVLPPRNPDA